MNESELAAVKEDNTELHAENERLTRECDHLKIERGEDDIMIPTNEWKWFGTHGHFVCGQHCRFHLCTQVGKYLISTLGEYIHPRHSNGNERDEYVWLKENWPGEEIGCGRKYETMVFFAGEPCSEPSCNCGLPLIDGHEIDMNAYNVRGEANRGHLEMCKKYAEMQ